MLLVYPTLPDSTGHSRIRPQQRPTILTRTVLLACLVPFTACDEKLEVWLKRASDRQERLEKRKQEEERKKSLPITSVEVDRLLEKVAQSDAQFIIEKKPGDARILNGRDFAQFLHRKSRWLGGGIEDVPTWLDEIGSGEFFSRQPYRVRLMDGQELTFHQWLLKNHYISDSK